ncbi:MAG TPA: methionyl-tRNA formyltransferase [Gemmatimonadota bacterium]
MRVLFWGTPEFALPALDAVLASSHELVGLVTQPDRPRGRSGRAAPSPTKRRVLEAAPSVPILQPEKPRGAAFRAEVTALAPDVSVVAAYGNILPRSVLDLPRHGSVNVHASLLPRHRGASPVAAAILAGDPVTGVSLMRMEPGLDTGPVLLRREAAILPGETCGELEARLAREGAALLLDALDALERGDLHPRPQDDSLATYAPRITPEDAHVDWRTPAEAVERHLRAHDPRPGAFTWWGGRRLKLFRGRLRPEIGTRERNSGEVLADPSGGLVVGARPGAIEVTEVQLEGGPRMDARSFLRGRPIPPGSRFW